MKCIKYLLLLLFPVIGASTCKKNSLKDPATATVKLLVTLNDTAAVLQLGDTLKMTLTIPDTLKTISKADGVVSDLFIYSLQRCGYHFTFYNIDTVTNFALRITDPSKIFVTSGSLESISGVNTTNVNKPFNAVLNLIPPYKGLFYVQFDRQENYFTANNTFNAGTRFNFNVSDKHWVEYADYFNGANQPDFITSVSSLSDQGYGFYCFWVN